ncbi:hypothetical protein F53441_3277 [Fusarium austroafricanum]|uniref:AB hydrolase-1 domain-containing protein n=1 Tax=Fusarium austroafricanum TaxID=2364996 RepID=A0A8H4P337_9HYPO|nr:hypothetical protein F53441_3277 [Fusarium austroafricanum]
MASPKAVLLITGAWHVPEHYYKLTDELKNRGIRVICEPLPTNNNVVQSNKTINDDINFIKEIVSKEAAAGTHLAVICHSYGGVLESAALAPFAVSPESNKGGVVDMISMSASIPSETESLADIFGGKLPPFLVAQSNGTVVPTDPIQHFYHGLPQDEAQWAEKLRVAHSMDAQHAPIDCEKAAWRVIPLTYIICEEDQGLLSFLQEMMIGKVEEQGVKVKQYRLGSSHSPFLSMPEKVAEVVLEVISS